MGFKIQKQFKESWKYLGECKNYFLFVLLMFMLFFFIALILPVPEGLENQLKEIIRLLFEKTQGLNLSELIFFILKNNFLVSLFGIFLGVFFGIIPLIIAISNGYVLGYVFKIVIENEGVFSLWRILPHGIFEIPAIIISLGIGISLGVSAFLSLGKNSFSEFFKEIKSALKTFIFIIFPLLIAAAIIEGCLIIILG